jgi:hypothetical protein
MSALRRLAFRFAALLACACAGACAGAGPAAAYFEEVGSGARAQGMGTAGAAMTDDVTAFYWNPAALDRLSRSEAFAAYGRLLGSPGLYAGAVAVGGRAPGRLKSLGIAGAWHRFGVSDVYSEDLWQLSVGRTVRRFPSGHEIALGGALKVGRVGLTPYPDPVSGAPVDYGAKTALSFDSSVLWRSPWKLDVAWTAYDWTSPDYGFFAPGEGTEVPTRHRLAAAYRWNRESTLGAAWTSAGTHGTSRFDLGIEIWFYDVFAIRSGLTDLGGLPDPGTSAQRFQYAGGVGLRDKRWRFDAAVATTRELGTSYRFSLIVPFGQAPAAAPAVQP